MSQTKKILILLANPQNTGRLRLDEEVREIEEGLQRSKNRGLFTIQSKWAVRLRDLRRALLDYRPQIVHFCGHGEVNGLVVEDTDGKAVLVNPDALASLFELFNYEIECVFLNACYSELQANAINEYIEYVIGIGKEISDKAAIEFALGFYDALGAGKSVEEAFKFGRNAIQLYSIPVDSIPILSRSKNFHEYYVFDPRKDSSTERVQVFRFRAEFEGDVDKLCAIIRKHIKKITKTIYPEYMGATDVEIDVNLSLKELRDAMRKVQDCHVMVQTVAPRDQYTGERDDSL